MVGSSPVAEEIVQLRIQVLGGKVPRFHKEVVEIRLVNGADRGVGVGISSEQRPLRLGKYLACLLQEHNTIHVRHALIGKQKGDAIVANLQRFEQVQCAFWRIAADDAIFGTRSEEHTSELQSLRHLVCRLLLEKKKT